MVSQDLNYLHLSADNVAFLLNNGATYWYSHAIGLAEYFISSYYWPTKYDHFFTSFPFSFIGMPLPFSPLYKAKTPVLALLLCAQALRSLAMIHASVSFSHVVKAVKHDDHTLITHGVYA
jgi:protein-S-isoprenylcysteine O-methyltransferase